MSLETPSAANNTRLHWYRTPLSKELLAELNTRSDLKGWLQCLGHLGTMLATGSLAFYALAHWAWYTLIPILFLHGTFYAFQINAVHELVHRSVFKTRRLNDFFVRIFGFLGWMNFNAFYISHMRHHQYTLHPPDDLEVTLPIVIVAKQFFKTSFINPMGIVHVVRGTWRIARGGFCGEWELFLFPPDEPGKRAYPIKWARILLLGHGCIIAASIALKLWLLPVLTTFAPFYGTWLFFLCNNTQHIGLQDNVPDFRLCCRTFTANPIVQFFYWHMNYHTEHHMFAMVPCYNLGKLHRALQHDLPPCPHGLLATWREIAAIQQIQAADPAYQHHAPLPELNAAAAL